MVDGRDYEDQSKLTSMSGASRVRLRGHDKHLFLNYAGYPNVSIGWKWSGPAQQALLSAISDLINHALKI